MASSTPTSEQNQPHPRRTSQRMLPRSLSVASDDPNISSLQKSGTFHSPTTLSSTLYDPLQDVKPKRSNTDLDCFANLTGEPDKRVVAILDSYDKSAAGDAHLFQNTFDERDVLPVPYVTLGHSSAVPDPSRMKGDQVLDTEHHHVSDSGIGTSIETGASDPVSIGSSSAVTRSFSAVQSANNSRPLSGHAIEQIKERIIEPILQEDALKDFHPLVQDVPRRIKANHISNLRDLEKTFIFLAPDLSGTPGSYLRFCETSIRCIHATVTTLSERDQRRPSDRPYTNYYFLDLIEQVHKYAAILAATRNKVAAGGEVDEMDYSADEKVHVRGGLSNDGNPIQLVREKGGKEIPLSEELEPSTKRPLSPLMDDEGVRRSMGRRRRSERAGDVIHICHECGKHFRRPCDLTKHEKTHTRPWKCTELSCKYAVEGWPTEKERDRHVNDKHCANPVLFRCGAPNCPYSSKRESNCKQHREKAHGIIYPRTRPHASRATGGSSSVSSTPNNTPGSVALPIGDLPVNDFIPSATPFMSPETGFPDLGKVDGSCPSATNVLLGTPISIFNEHQTPEVYPAETADLFAESVAGHVPLPFGTGGFMTTPSNESVGVPMTAQQPTPAQSADLVTLSEFEPSYPYQGGMANIIEDQVTFNGLSPNAQPNLVLSAVGAGPYDNMIEDVINDGSARDFTLFPSVSQSNPAAMGLFQPIAGYSGSTDSVPFTEMAEAFDDNQLYTS